jgi:hypothetical protein
MLIFFKKPIFHKEEDSKKGLIKVLKNKIYFSLMLPTPIVCQVLFATNYFIKPDEQLIL